MAILDLVGHRFGRLAVIARAASRGGRGYWTCKCDCGAVRVVYTGHLRTHHTQSCGCYHRDVRTRAITHGHARKGGLSSELPTWDHAQRPSTPLIVSLTMTGHTRQIIAAGRRAVNNAGIDARSDTKTCI